MRTSMTLCFIHPYRVRKEMSNVLVSERTVGCSHRTVYGGIHSLLVDMHGCLGLLT